MPSSASQRRKRAREQAKSDIEAILAAAATGTLASLSLPSTASLDKAAADSGATVSTIAAIIAVLALARGGADWIEELMRGEFPSDGEEAVENAEISAAAELEVEREREFLANMRKRLERDIPPALKEADPVAAVNAILEREQRYMEQHDDAAAARAHATIRRGQVRRLSPEGAYWIMSPAVKEHTPDCIAMAAVGWWPWSVLDAINPPLHTGCQCDLITRDQAIGLGYIEMDFEPMDEAEARDRAKAIQQEYGLEEAWRDWPPLDEDDLMEVRWNRRYAKGTIWGGRFMPRRGGFAPRISIRDILRRLMGPDAPPVASRGGQPTIAAPDPDEISKGMPSPPKINPITGRKEGKRKGDKNHPLIKSISGLSVKFASPGSSGDGVSVAEAAKEAVGNQEFSRANSAMTRMLGRVQAEAAKWGTEPSTPDFVSISGEGGPETNGLTSGGIRGVGPDGQSKVAIGEWELASLIEEDMYREAGIPLPSDVAARAYNARRTLAHELTHDHSAISEQEYSERADAFALEEALTEELAHIQTVSQLLADGETDILNWLAQNPNDPDARGVYLPQREGLATVLDYGNVPEEDRQALLERLSMTMDKTDDRINELAKFVAEAQGVNQQRAVDIVRGALFDYGSRAERVDPDTGEIVRDVGVEFGGQGRRVLSPNVNFPSESPSGFAEGDMVRTTNGSIPEVGKVIKAEVGSDGKPLLTLEVPNLDADGRKIGVAHRYPDPDSIEKVADAPRKQLKGSTVTGKVKVGDTVMVTEADGSMFKGTLERIAAMGSGGEFTADIRRSDGISKRVRDTSVRNIRRATANDRSKVPAPPKSKKKPVPGGAKRVKVQPVSGPRGFDPRRYQDPRRALLNKVQALPPDEELMAADGSIITRGKRGSVTIERPDGSRKLYSTPQRMVNAESVGISKRVGPGMASPADGDPNNRKSAAFQIEQDAALDRLEGMRSPDYVPNGQEHEVRVGDALLSWVESPNSVSDYNGPALEYEVRNGPELFGPFFRGQPVERAAPPESGRYRGWSYDLDTAVSFATNGPEVRRRGRGVAFRPTGVDSALADLEDGDELVISIYKAESASGVDINERLAEVATNIGIDEERMAEIRAEAESETLYEMVQDRFDEPTVYDEALRVLSDEFDVDLDKVETDVVNKYGGAVPAWRRRSLIASESIEQLSRDQRRNFFERLDEAFAPDPNQEALPGIEAPEAPASFANSYDEAMNEAESIADDRAEFDEFGDPFLQYQNSYADEREVILDNDQMEGYERVDVVIFRGGDDSAAADKTDSGIPVLNDATILERVNDALNDPDSRYRATPKDELLQDEEPDFEDLEAIESEIGESLEADDLAAIGMASPPVGGFQRALSPDEKVLRGMASPAVLDKLSDGDGPVEARLRAALNAVGVDPYDVDLDALTAHADLHEAEPQSRFEVAGQGVSPCAFSRKIDYAVHVLLPEMLREKYPDLAQELRDTSPRWGHRTGRKPLGLATPTDQPGMASPGVLYHTAPASARESIARDGLDFRKGGQVGFDGPGGDPDTRGNYLFKNRAEAERWQSLAQSTFGEPFDLYEVDPTGLDLEADPDPEYPDARLSRNPIQPSQVTRVDVTDGDPSDRKSLAFQAAQDRALDRVGEVMRSPGYTPGDDHEDRVGQALMTWVQNPDRALREGDAEALAWEIENNGKRFSGNPYDMDGTLGLDAPFFRGQAGNLREPRGDRPRGWTPNLDTAVTFAMGGATMRRADGQTETQNIMGTDLVGEFASPAESVDFDAKANPLESVVITLYMAQGGRGIDINDRLDDAVIATGRDDDFDNWDYSDEREFIFTGDSLEGYERVDVVVASADDLDDPEYRLTLAEIERRAKDAVTNPDSEYRAAQPPAMASPSRRTEILDDGLHEVFSMGDKGYIGTSHYGDDAWIAVAETDSPETTKALVDEVKRNYPDGDIHIGDGVMDDAEALIAAGATRADIPEGMESPGFQMMKRLLKGNPQKKPEVERSLLEKPPQPIQGIPNYEAVSLADVKGAGGSNDARIAVDASGNSWLLKAYRGNADRVATELLANAIYRELGITVSNAGVGTNRHPQFGEQVAVAYPLIAGDIRQWDTPNAALGEGFVADALVANWDVIGLTQDNVLWNGDTPIRLDQGGTLAFRAMGGRKPFGPVPTEMWTMRDERGQANGTMEITEAGMIAQAQDAALRLTPDRIDDLVDQAPFEDEEMREEVREALKSRVAWLERFARGEEKMPEPLENEEVSDLFVERDTNLTTMPTEDAAIEAYFGELGPEIDDHLQRQRPKESASDEVRQAVTEMDMILGIDETKLDEDIIVHVPIPPVAEPEKLVGNWVTERSFLPTEVDRPEGVTSVRLKVPAGVNAVMPAALDIQVPESPETDVLLPRNSQIKVTGVSEVEGDLVLDAVLRPAPAYKPSKPKPSAKPIGDAPKAEIQPLDPDMGQQMFSPGRAEMIAERVTETMNLYRGDAQVTAEAIVEARLTDRPELDTDKYFADSSGTYTPERAVFHRQQLDFIRGDSQPVPEGETPKAVFMSGGSAAGKGTLLAEGVIERPDDIVHTDADEFKELIPEFQVLKEMGEDDDIEGVDLSDAAPIVHEESSYLSKVAAADALATRRNLLVDAVGGSASYFRRVEEARDAGYDVEVNLVINDPDQAFEQAAARAEETGRTVPLFAIYGSHRNVSRTFANEFRYESPDGAEIGEPHKPLTARGVPGKVYDGRTRELVATWDADGNITVLNQDVYDEWQAVGRRPHPALDPEMPARNARARELLEKAKKRRAKRREMEAEAQREQQSYDETVGVAA